MRPNNSTDNAVFHHLHELINSGWWGSVSLRIESGHIAHVYKEESLKPETLKNPCKTYLPKKDEPNETYDTLPK